MYGLEKGKKGTSHFEFDLELEMKKNPQRSKELLDKTLEKEREIKAALREGTSDKEELDHLGTLLQGYTALQKVIKKMGK